ncbi:hypothetical protein HIM_00273 [Hirsutella minnesotensis 3608]|nr:hypothetical protein HIM_00273 [Hirsutella minnesotensis 3608]
MCSQPRTRKSLSPPLNRTIVALRTLLDNNPLRLISNVTCRQPSLTRIIDTAIRYNEYCPVFLVRSHVVVAPTSASLTYSITNRLGWGSLCVAGAGAYVFAKREINADRQAKLEQARKKRNDLRSLEYTEPASSDSSTTANGGPARTDSAGSPSLEASSDPAPTRHAPATESERVAEKSKYESSTTYRSPKGDRFS